MKQTLKIKCPHCGWVRSIEIDFEIGKAEVAKGSAGSAGEGLAQHLAQPSHPVKEFFYGLSKNWQEKIQPLLKEDAYDPENDWLPLPPCPHCGKSYEYNVKTGKTR